MRDFSEEVVNQVIGAYGSVKAAQEALEYKNAMTVYNWRQKGIPKIKVPEIHLDTGIDVARLLDGVSGAEKRSPRACG